MNNNLLVAVVGPSGSGKDTLVDELIRRHPEWTKLKSKVTRMPRFPAEDTHVFASEEEYWADEAAGDVVAHNFYDGNHYWATKDQIDSSFFYIVDIPGLKELKEKYDGAKKILTIGLGVSPLQAIERMKHRNDSDEAIYKRLAVDSEAFANLNSYVDNFFNTNMIRPDMLASEVEALIMVYLALGKNTA